MFIQGSVYVHMRLQGCHCARSTSSVPSCWLFLCTVLTLLFWDTIPASYAWAKGVLGSLPEIVALNAYGAQCIWKHSWPQAEKWICGSVTRVPVSSSGPMNLSSCFLVPGLDLSPSDKAVHSLALCRGLTTDCGVNPVFPEKDKACGLLVRPLPSSVPVTYLDG